MTEYSKTCKTKIFTDFMRDSLKKIEIEDINEDSIKRLSNQIGNISSDVIRLKTLFRDLKTCKPYYDEYCDIKDSIDDILYKYVEINKKRSSSSSSSNSSVCNETNESVETNETNESVC